MSLFWVSSGLVSSSLFILSKPQNQRRTHHSFQFLGLSLLNGFWPVQAVCWGNPLGIQGRDPQRPLSEVWRSGRGRDHERQDHWQRKGLWICAVFRPICGGKCSAREETCHTRKNCKLSPLNYPFCQTLFFSLFFVYFFFLLCFSYDDVLYALFWWPPFSIFLLFARFKLPWLLFSWLLCCLIDFVTTLSHSLCSVPTFQFQLDLHFWNGP